MSFYTDKITDVEELFEYVVVEDFIVARADFVAVDVDLHFAGRVRQYSKGSLAHDAFSHQSARDAHLFKTFHTLAISSADVFGKVRTFILSGWVRVDAQCSQLAK